MSKIDRIFTFVTVIQQGSFVAAAKKLKTAPLTITRQINALESELGVSLIERTTRSIKLTPIGELYYDEANKLLIQYEATESLITNLRKEPSGHLKVIVHSYIAREYVQPHLAEFLACYPKIELQLNLLEVSPRFSKEDADLLFGTLGEGPADMVRRKITSSPFIYCASPDYLKTYGSPQTPGDLLQHRFITHTLRDPADKLTFHNHEPIYIKPYLSVNDSELMLQSAISGIGIIKVLEWRVRQYLNAGTLLPILTHYHEPNSAIYLYYHKQRYSNPKIRAFIDFFWNKTKL